MNEPITLRTYQEQSVRLTDDEAHFLASRVDSKIRIRRPLEGGGYLVNPHQYVGVVALPTGRSLSITPQISAAHVLFMLATAYQMKARFFDELEGFETFEELLEPVASFLADLVEDRIQAGLYRAYVDTEDNLGVVRGRIDFPRDVAYNSVLRHRIYCRYSELTWDIPENQIIRYVCHQLSGWNFRRTELRRRLMNLDNQLEEVSRPAFTAAQADSFTHHRLNEPYRRIHRLCSLFLEASSLSEASGATDFRTFLLDMNKLFEQFVTQSLHDRLLPPWHVSGQESLYLGQHNRVPMRPDILVWLDGRCHVVADCKYKRVNDESEYVQHDYYQVLAYCTALGIDRGILIYPKHEIAVEDSVAIRNSDVVILRLSVDLATHASGLRKQCDQLAREIRKISIGDLAA